MRENKKSPISPHMPAIASSVSGQHKNDHPFGATSLWLSVVSHLEDSVSDDLSSEDKELTVKSIRSLRHFAVASTMNKSVISNSSVLRPRLIELLERVPKWSASMEWSMICVDLCGLVNSLIRDCSSLADDILSRMGLLQQLILVILQPCTLDQVRETCLLLLRSLFLADDLSSLLLYSTCHSTIQIKRRQAALDLFSRDILSQLLGLFGRCEVPGVPSPPSGCKTPPHSLTHNAFCWLVELLSVLATEPSLAHCLHSLGAMSVCHRIVDVRPSVARRRAPDSTKLSPIRRGPPCALHPTNQLATKFALKTMVHLAFHVESALASFKQASRESDSLQLLSCYSHLVGAAAPAVCYSPAHDPKRRPPWGTTPTISPTEGVPQGSRALKTTGLPVITNVTPTSHTTQALVGLLRGLLYWRLWADLDVDRDQLDEELTSSVQPDTKISADQRLGVTDNDVALLIIQPLTEAYLNLENTRLLAWICHVLVMILNDRPDLQLWTAYTNSFVREVNLRLTSLLKAVHEASNGHNHAQLVAHLIPIVRLFTCLASGAEATRVMIGELSMCENLVDFVLRLKSLGPNRVHLFREFQHAVAAFLHILSRSFRLHHTLFFHEEIGPYLLKLVDDSLAPAASGHQLCIDLAHSASAAIANLILPMSRLREVLSSDAGVSTFIRLATMRTETEQPVSTPSTRRPNLLKVNGIWCMANLLHTASPEVCSHLFQQLVASGAWLEILKATTLAGQLVSQLVSQTGDCDRQGRREGGSDLADGEQMAEDAPEESPAEDLADGAAAAGQSMVGIIGEEERDGVPASGQLTPGLADINVPIGCGTVLPVKHTRSTCFSEAHLLIYQTLRLLRNLLRDEQVIDMVVEEHWWNITQLIVLVLEGGQPQTIKEMAILLVAHLAIGRQAGNHLQHNEDLIEKLKVFMRSSNSYTKSAALTATYNLLGLGREDDSGNGNRDGATEVTEPSSQPLEENISQPQQENTDDDNRGESLQVSSTTEGGVRQSPSAALLVAPTGLIEVVEEQEEELDPTEDREDDLAYEAMSALLLEATPPATPYLLSSGSRRSGASSGSPELSRRRRQPQSQASPLSRLIGSTAVAVGHVGRQTGSEQRSTAESPSLRTPVSSAASSSPAEDETRAARAQSSSCDAGDHRTSVSTLLGDCNSIIAPLATQERLEDVESGPYRCCEDASQPCSCAVQASVVALGTDSQTGADHLATTTPFDETTNTDNEASLPSDSSPHSNREWEMGFRQILLPFLQELNDDPVLRSTWDWLMLRAERHNQPVRLHHMLEAWQLLFNQLPSFHPSSSRRLIAVGSSPANSPDSLQHRGDSAGSVTVQTFLRRLQQSSNSANLSLSSILRQTAVSCSLSSTEYRQPQQAHHRRRHRRHNCHRHQLRSSATGSQPSTTRGASSTPPRSTPDEPSRPVGEPAEEESVSQTSPPGSD